MIRLGIVCIDTDKVEQITEIIYDYTHMPPRYRVKGLTQWIFPLLSIEIMTPSHACGCRFDLVFYDENIKEEYVNEIIWPCCNSFGSKPQPLERLLWRFPTWRNMTTEEKQPQT